MESKTFGYGRVSSKEQNEERQLLMKEIFILISKVEKILIEKIILH